MRKLALALLLTLAATSAQAQTTQLARVQRSYTADNVLAVLGKTGRPSPRRMQTTFIDASAGVNTKVECGALRINFNLKAMADKVTRIPSQLKTQAQALIPALPMLILCQSSPSLCAEIKNLNYQINEELKGLSDICRSMDSYIESQAREGRARGWRNCVQKHMDDGEELSDAQLNCNELPDTAPEKHPLYTDIAKGWAAKNLTDQPQRLIKSLLESTGESVSSGLGEQKYHFLSSVLGELQLEVNGNKLPIFPSQPRSVDELAKTIGGEAITTACNTVELRRAANQQLQPSTDPDGTVRAYRNALNEIMQARLTTGDVDNLEVLDAVNLQPACHALGRALARSALDKLKNDSLATMAQLTANPALDEETRKALDERTILVTTAMASYRFEGGANLEVQDVLKIIQRMAADTRERLRQDAAVNARGQMRFWKEMDKTRCTGLGTCER